MKRNAAKDVAIGGMLAALAVIIMCLGGLIPASTFVCPMICCFMTQMVLRRCGARIAWAWYGAVAILSVLMGPDKEAAAVFAFLGYYPIIKPWMDCRKLPLLWKTVYFNAVILAMYAILIHLFGMQELASEYRELGYAMTILMLILGNITFFMLDRLLSQKIRRRK